MTTTLRIGFAVSLAVLPLWVSSPAAQDRPASGTGATPKIDIVQTIGCVERRGGASNEWWLTRAAEPTVVRAGVFSISQVDEAREAALGDQTFELIGVADFLDTDGLLATADRSLFTTPESANATGELAQGRRVLVKGALIPTDDAPRINLLAVVSLADNCG